MAKRVTAVDRIMAEFIICGGILFQRRILWMELLADDASLDGRRRADYFAFKPTALDMSGDSVLLPLVLPVAVAPGERQRMTAKQAGAWIAERRLV